MFANLQNTAGVFIIFMGLLFIIQADDNGNSLRSSKSEEMLKYLNKSVDPCANFYDYACGNWITIRPASKTKYETSVFQDSKEDLQNKILALPEANETNDSQVQQNAKNFYQSCLKAGNESKLAYKQDLKDMVQEFGKIPFLAGQQRWRASKFDWLKTIADISHSYDINIILGYKIMVDLQDNSVNRLYLTHPDFPLKSLTMYLDRANEVYRQKYLSLIKENLETFLEIPSTLAQQTAQEILDFEIALVKGTQRYTVRGKELHFPTTVEKLHALHQPNLDIKRLLEISLGFIPSGNITVKNPGYQTNLIDLLNRTPKRKVANYIGYNLMVHFLLPMDTNPGKLQAKCLEKTKGHFANLLDHMVYKQLENSNLAEEAVQNMFQSLKRNFQLALESGKYDWINETTRQHAVDKLKAMKLEINSYNHVNFSQDYGTLNLSKDNYVANCKAIFSLNALKSRSKLNQPVQAYYDGAAMSFGPRYILTENAIKIPVATLLSHHFWSASYPLAVAYARLGFLIAHEMMHGFDDEGRTFDKQGNDRDWWDAISAQGFDERTTCFREQYTNYAQGTNVSRKTNQQSENIADNGGVRLAYESFNNWQKEFAITSPALKATEMLPDFQDFSPQQLFFLSFAQLWCYDILPELRSIKFSNDIHEPGNLRVIGPLSNMPEFSEAFKCTRGSGMNPAKKCEIF
ncbi:neprilysin-4-like [Stomoxys calcitrans]|uniref:neprilysin-4-like n=1 Tax=Stomoxys calcitrans TaxID=35570 RepID=UPI0027E3AEAF|nr:neprilysin-4-like [Stomoxys calcitrans]